MLDHLGKLHETYIFFSVLGLVVFLPLLGLYHLHFIYAPPNRLEMINAANLVAPE